MIDGSQSISKLGSRMAQSRESERSDLRTKIVEQSAVLKDITGQVIHIKESVEQARLASDDGIAALSSEIAVTKASVMSMKGIGYQIISFLSSFPLEMRDFLQKILQSNWQMYQMLLDMQQRPAQSPTGLLESNIKFEDAMGELKELPYEYFRHWEVKP